MKMLIERALARNNGNRTRTARELGIERTYLQKLITRYEIGVPSGGAA